MSRLAPMVALLAVLFVGCDSDDSNENNDSNSVDHAASLGELCPVNCALEEKCYGFTGDRTLTSCTVECIGWRTDDLNRMGDTCDALMIELLECEYYLSCDNYITYHGDGPNAGSPCIDEHNAYHITNDCMGNAE